MSVISWKITTGSVKSERTVVQLPSRLQINHGIACSICQEKLAANKLFEKHVREKHRITGVLYFCECGYSNPTAKATGQHKRNCVMGGNI